MSFQMLLVPVFLVVLIVYSFVKEPRKVRIGVYLLALILYLIPVFFIVSFEKISKIFPYSHINTWISVFILLLFAISVFASAAILILNGIVVVRREGRSLGHLTTLIVGILILVFFIVSIVTILHDHARLGLILLMASLPISWCGYGFISYLIWSWLYTFTMGYRGIPVQAVIVLGASVRSGTVGPLLAARIDRGIEWANRVSEAKQEPVIVFSGGKGIDEPVSEAQAMAAYAEKKDGMSTQVLLEEESTSTLENLIFSMRALKAQGITGPVAVVTSSYHAPRAALLMRRLEISGYSVGSRTAGYYWPSAVLREYAACIAGHRLLNFFALLTLCIPLVVSLVLMATGA